MNSKVVKITFHLLRSKMISILYVILAYAICNMYMYHDVSHIKIFFNKLSIIKIRKQTSYRVILDHKMEQ